MCKCILSKTDSDKTRIGQENVRDRHGETTSYKMFHI